MENKITQQGVITHIGEEWSTANIIDELGKPVDRTGVPTNILPIGTKVGDKVTFFVTVTTTLTKVEKQT